MSDRQHAVDILRGASILIIIFLHIAPRYLGIPWVAWGWNWLQFAVSVILLCSVAVGKMPETPFDLQTYLKYIGKRVKRLLIPYYIFFGVYTAVIYWFTPHKLNMMYFVQNSILTGGIDFHWLVLLFILLAVITPLTDRLYIHNRKMYFVLMALSLVLSCFYQFNRPWWNANYRLWMTGSWLSIVLIARWVIDLYRQRRWADSLTIIFGSLSVWGVILLTLVSQHTNLGTYYHKYPPDIFHISYSIWTMVTAFMCVEYLSNEWLEKKWWRSYVIPLMRWCSTYSYELFFTHLIITTIINLSFPHHKISIWLLCLVVYVSTILAVALGNKLKQVYLGKSQK